MEAFRHLSSRVDEPRSGRGASRSSGLLGALEMSTNKKTERPGSLVAPGEGILLG